MTYSVKVGIENSNAVSPIAFFCPCNAPRRHPSNLSIQKAATLSPLPRLFHPTRWELHRGPNCDAFAYEEKQWMEMCIQEGPLNSHTSWQWEWERNKVFRVFCQFRAESDGLAPGSTDACSSSCQCLSCTPGALGCPSGSAASAGPNTELQRFWHYCNPDSNEKKVKLL